ncbi:MAG TPA: Crp/Fnr family transcriptional regulator [Burkholderiales bacterium]|nr:Crp/Fnr family transcriptional regulator [Burkholderiales bacterium]
MKTEIKVTTFLANLPLFKETAAEEIERIAQGTRALHLTRGEILFHRGDPCEGFHLVVYGQVKLAITSPQGADKVVEVIGPGMSFGEAVMFLEKPYPVYAQTLADSLLLHVSKSVVFAEIERNPGFSRRLLGGLSRRLHGLVSDVEAYSLRSGAQRVIGYLLRDVQVSDAAGGEVTLPISKGVIASRLNLTPQHFSRILHELTAQGLIAVQGRTVRITDLARLRAYD